jgi:transcriptional regulator with XRE-family HTH domain
MDSITTLYENNPWNVRMEAIRILKGLERKTLADMIGVCIWNYNSWASGRHFPMKNNRRILCNILNVKEEYIFGDYT